MNDASDWRKGKMQKGLRAIITGASTGIGRALALQLAREFQAEIVINARGKEDLENTARLVQEASGKAVCVVGDVSDGNVCAEIVKACLTEYGGVDVLINNAGLARAGTFSKLSIDDWRYVFDVNLFSALNMTYGVLPSFLEQGYGKLVNIASVAGKVAFPGSICYASSKFAMTGFSEGMAAEFSGKFDTITVCPGLVRTDFFRRNQSQEDVTLMAEQKSFRGWLMRNIISISSEQASEDIVRALRKGGSHELVLTAPGVFIDRLAGCFPDLAFYLSSLIPAERGRSKT